MALFPRVLLSAFPLLAGCMTDLAAPEPAAPAADGVRGGGANITHLAGALFLHEFPASGHGTLNVVEKPISLAELDGREPFSLRYEPAARQGSCWLFLPPSCAPACAPSKLCTGPNQCTPITPLLNLDIGELQVTGSATAPLIRLWFIAPESSYGVDPAPGAAKLYAGGERLEITGGRGPYALHGSWPAPAPVVVYEPAEQQPLHLPTAGPFTLRWEPAGSSLMVVQLITSGRDGAWGNIRCLVPDSGSFTVPGELIAALPPPPRSVRYELERDEELLLPLPLGPGVGMLVHAGFTAWQNGTDPK
jgi:hypothetical protein